PPIFPGQVPIELEVPLEKVMLLELVTEGQGSARAAWIEGTLIAEKDRELGDFLPHEAPFNPKAYPVAFRRKVNEAIDRCVVFLLSRQEKNGSWDVPRRGHPMGATALVTLALLKAGVEAKDPQIEKAFAFLHRQNYDHTYSVSILLMALEARYFPGGADEKTAYVDRPKLAKKLISEEDQTWIRDAAKWLVEQQGAGFRSAGRKVQPVWRYPAGGYDLSNTQYALFGLSAANRCGVPTSRVWLPVLRFLLGAQERNGPEMMVSRYVRDRQYLHRKKEKAKVRGFGYTLNRAPTGSMTTAGLCSLVLCHQALHKKANYQTGWKKRTRTAIRDALAWLEEYYDVTENPMMGGSWWTYYLFNLERAGVLLDQRYIGTRDWYREGAEVLMDSQLDSGSFGGLVDTSFALLFLKRATVPALTHPLR
ncbi:MAG: prenyltransferase/squalene oxidase repeat-containing protein, partial [Planctomycetota bacterium]